MSVEHTHRLNSSGLDMTRGTLVIAGGAIDYKNPTGIVNRFSRFIPQETSIEIIPLGSAEIEQQLASYSGALDRSGVARERIVAIDEPHKLLPYVNNQQRPVVVVTGGGQDIFMDNIGVEGARAIQQAYERGGVFLTSSAGSMALSEHMLLGVHPFGAGQMTSNIDVRREPSTGNNIELRKGIGIFKKIIIDTHFGQRERDGRLQKAIVEVATKNDEHYAMGIGIDENTALIVHQSQFLEVQGEGRVHVYECRVTSKRMPHLDVHHLSSGTFFNINRSKKEA